MNPALSSKQLSPNLQDVYRLAVARLRMPEQWIHGPSHWLKVTHNAALLAGQVEGADAVVGQLFGLLHDCERENDGSDPQHGPRAAIFAAELHRAGKLPIDVAQLKKLVFACERHDLGETHADPTIGICWDADRLELPRVGIRVDPRYLSTRAAKRLILPE